MAPRFHIVTINDESFDGSFEPSFSKRVGTAGAHINTAMLLWHFQLAFLTAVTFEVGRTW